MEIEVKTDELVEKLEKALEDYKTKIDEIWGVYVTKEREYVQYLRKFKTYPSKFKSAPYLSLPSTTDLQSALDGLKLHTKDTVTIDDNEYHNLINGIEKLRAGSGATLSAITSLRYK